MQRFILVADSNPAFLIQLKRHPKCAQIPIIGTLTGKDAQLALANKDQTILALIISSAIGDPPWHSVCRSCKMHRPGIPIYLVSEGKLLEGIEAKELEKLGVDHVIQKPYSYEEIVTAVTPTISLQATSTTPSAGDNAKLDETFTAEDHAFVSIPAKEFLSGSTSLFNVFIKLSSEKYVKILNASESFDAKRLKGYLDKGVEFLYIAKDDHQRYVAFCEKIAAGSLKMKSADLEVQTKFVLTHGEETINYLKSSGLGHESLQFATNFVKNVEGLIHNLGCKRNSFVSGFFTDLKKYDHGVSTSFIASLLANALKFTGEKAIHVIGLASLLHDVGLVKVSMDCDAEFDPKLSPEEKKIFQSHPVISGEILSEIRDVDPVVVQAVVQHHERRTRKGYPSHLGPGAINRVAEIVGISDDFVRLIKSMKDTEDFIIDRELETVYNGYSFQVTEAFKTLFIPPNKKSPGDSAIPRGWA